MLEVDVLLAEGVWRLEMGGIHNYGCQIQLKGDYSTSSIIRLRTGRVSGSGRSCSAEVGFVACQAGEDVGTDCCSVLVQTPRGALWAEWKRMQRLQMRERRSCGMCWGVGGMWHCGGESVGVV